MQEEEEEGRESDLSVSSPPPPPPPPPRSRILLCPRSGNWPEIYWISISHAPPALPMKPALFLSLPFTLPPLPLVFFIY